jgi:nucleoside-diphosphate-sugar epimerase
MRIAIFGATSQIAKDLIISLSEDEGKYLHLFARRPDEVTKWLASVGLQECYPVDVFAAFGMQRFDLIINFVGVGNPAQTMAMGASIFDLTLRYDLMALDYLQKHPDCRYFFLSSGAVYGSSFDEPADATTNAMVAINNLLPQDWYGVAKLYAECRHRALPHLSIMDIRVFNYFSSSQNLTARFFISDVIRAIQADEILVTSPQNIVRDYVGASDFYILITSLTNSPPSNDVVDCYSKAPVSKFDLLDIMTKEFGLKFVISDADVSINATGVKAKYYSKNKKAEKYGYFPTSSSKEIVVSEARSILQCSQVFINPLFN